MSAPDHPQVCAPRLIGLSGGKDSTGLAVWLCTQQPAENWHLVHVRHGLRDDEPDARAAEATALRLGRPFHEVPAIWDDRVKGAGPEDEARHARYAAFTALAATLGATDLYLGHSADDQAETILLRLVRGTGPTGMAGMRPLTNRGELRIHRPLLGWPRDAVRALADGYPTVEDPTNSDLNQRRAFIRHQVLPTLANARPDRQSPTAAIARYAEVQAEHNELLAHLTAPYRGPAWGPIQRVPHHPHMPASLTRYLIHEALGQGVSRALVNAIADLPLGNRRDLADRQMVARDQYGWVIGPKDVAWAIEIVADDAFLSCEIAAGIDPIAACPLPWKIPISKEIPLNDLAIRMREPQDSRHKKIFNRFPKSLRVQLPVVYTVSNGEVVAIGPLSLTTSQNNPARVQWITLIPGIVG